MPPMDQRHNPVQRTFVSTSSQHDSGAVWSLGNESSHHAGEAVTSVGFKLSQPAFGPRSNASSSAGPRLSQGVISSERYVSSSSLSNTPQKATEASSSKASGSSGSLWNAYRGAPPLHSGSSIESSSGTNTPPQDTEATINRSLHTDLSIYNVPYQASNFLGSKVITPGLSRRRITNGKPKPHPAARLAPHPSHYQDATPKPKFSSRSVEGRSTPSSSKSSTHRSSMNAASFYGSITSSQASSPALNARSRGILAVEIPSPSSNDSFHLGSINPSSTGKRIGRPPGAKNRVRKDNFTSPLKHSSHSQIRPQAPISYKKRGRPFQSAETAAKAAPKAARKAARAAGTYVEATRQPKLLGRPKIVRVHEEIPVPEPVFNVWVCEWSGCKAELHNLETLEVHMKVCHWKRGVEGKYVCMWRKCCIEEYEKNLVAEWTEENDKTWTGKKEVPDSARQVFVSKREWKEHLKIHVQKVAWFMGDGPKNTDSSGELRIEDFQLYRFDASGQEVVPSIATQTQEAGSMRENNKKRFKKVHDGKGIISISLREIRSKGEGIKTSSVSGDRLSKSIVQVIIQSNNKAKAQELDMFESESEEEFVSADEAPTLSRPINLGEGRSLGYHDYGHSIETSDAMEIDESEDELSEGDKMVLGHSQGLKDAGGE